jgi:tryptophanyl-tRNA synthetase
VEQPKDPETCNLFQIFRHFAPHDRVVEVERLYKEGGAAYGALKKELVGILWDYFKDQRAERARLLADPGHIRNVLASGAAKARAIAVKTMDEVRRRVGTQY